MGDLIRLGLFLLLVTLTSCGVIADTLTGSGDPSSSPNASTSGPDTSQVTAKPPQELIQILLGEARGQILSEVKATAPDYRSLTAEAIAAVIRNRIDLIDDGRSPSFFNADPNVYNSNPPASKYRAVIEARSSTGVPQFNPTDPRYESYEVYLAAKERDDLDDELLPAYDQALIVAAGIFDGSIEDPTGGAFGFFTPTAAQYELIDAALESGTTTLPANAGKSDASFPALAPIQFVLLEGTAPKSSREPYPAFIFVRSRRSSDPAVTDEL